MTSLRAWDGYDAYLFDIDGTLLHCTDAVHYFAFCDALSSVAGRPLNLDGVVAHGNVDIGILRDAFACAHVAEELWRPRLPDITAALCAQVERDQDQIRADALPCVREVLHRLRAKGALLGVATGNLEGIGRIKLARCGLLDMFDFGGYSDGYEHRADVFAAALRQARGFAGDHATVCVVGDTPADVQAARANGCDVVAVGTGVYSLEQLAAADPTWVVASLGGWMETDGSAPACRKPISAMY